MYKPKETESELMDRTIKHELTTNFNHKSAKIGR